MRLERWSPGYFLVNLFISIFFKYSLWPDEVWTGYIVYSSLVLGDFANGLSETSGALVLIGEVRPGFWGVLPSSTFFWTTA